MLKHLIRLLIYYLRFWDVPISYQKAAPVDLFGKVVERGLKTKFMGYLSHSRYDKAPSTDERRPSF